MALYTPTVKEHSLRKIRLHNFYVSLFSTAMKNHWPQRAYVGLYSGAGRARVAETGKIVVTTALSAVQARYPFTKYIFVDNNPRCIEALEARIQALETNVDVSFIEKDVSEAVPEVIRAMPTYSKAKGLTTLIRSDCSKRRMFCFTTSCYTASTNWDEGSGRKLGAESTTNLIS